MADIRCPMCSKNNPEGLDNCQFCGARITPVSQSISDANQDTIHPGEEPTKKSTAELEKALPDWLRSIRQGDDAEVPESIGPSDEILPELTAEDDFLSRLSSDENEPRVPTTADPTSMPADLLAGLSSSFDEEEDEIPDWLASVKSQVQQEAQVAQPVQLPEDMESSDAWLSEIDEEKPPKQEETEWTGFRGEPGFSADLGQDSFQFSDSNQDQAWFDASPDEKPLGASFEPDLSSNAPDWLKQLDEKAAEPASVTPEPAASADEGLPDWLAGMQAAEAPAPAIEPAAETFASEPAASADEGLPDWLAGMQAAEAPTPTLEPAAETFASEPAASADEGLPDWLAGMQAVETPTPTLEPATGIPTSEPATFADEGLPDWLAGMKAVEASQPPEGPTTPPSEDIPDWMTGSEPGSVPGIADQSTDWLAELDAQQQSPDTSASQQPEAFKSGLTGWLRSVDSEMPSPDQQIQAGAPALPDELVNAAIAGQGEDGQTIPSPDQGVPDWLLAATAAGAGLALASGAGKDEKDDGMSEDSSLSSATPAFLAASNQENDLLGMDMPDWLSGVSPSTPEVISEVANDTTASLEQSELPSWVQAMRPVEAVVSGTEGGEEEQFVETQGPLAGFKNVLPMAAGLISIRRPASYASKIQVSEAQQSNASLLESLLQPGAAASDKSSRRDGSLRFLRWAISALLITLVSIPIILGSTQTPIVNLVPPELGDAIQTVNQLPDNPLVLVAFDYEPSFAGEVSTAATPLLDHLMLKGAHLVFVSSIPTGMTQAQYLMDTTLQVHHYAPGQQYDNLGYIPGGAAGIYNFANNPRYITTDAGGNNPWRLSQDLARVNSLSDFDALVVLTESSDTGRVWVEQSRMALEDKPFLMAISAQAEPMLRPYYDSKQVQGMVTGLSGGATYEQINGRSGNGREYWDAFSVAFFVAEIIVLVGGAWALLAAWQSRRANGNGA